MKPGYTSNQTTALIWTQQPSPPSGETVEQKGKRSKGASHSSVNTNLSFLLRLRTHHFCPLTRERKMPVSQGCHLTFQNEPITDKTRRKKQNSCFTVTAQENCNLTASYSKTHHLLPLDHQDRHFLPAQSQKNEFSSPLSFTDQQFPHSLPLKINLPLWIQANLLKCRWNAFLHSYLKKKASCN